MVSPTMSGHASKAMPSTGMPTAAHSECSGAGTKNFSVVSMGIPAVAGVVEQPQSCHGKGPAPHHPFLAGAIDAGTASRRQSMRPAVCALCAQTHTEGA